MARNLMLLAALMFAGADARAGSITIGHTTWVGYGPLYLARDLGYFKEAGLDVELPTTEDHALNMAAQAAGHMEGSAATLDELLKYRSPGFCFKAVFALDESHGGDGILTQTSVADVAGLKGQSIAVNEGSTSEFFLSYLLAKQGLSISDVTITNMTADDAASAFITGHIPAAVTWEPHLTFARSKHIGKVLIDSTSAPGVIVDVVELSCDVIDKRPNDVAGLVKGYYRALAYMAAEPDKANAIMAKGVGGYLADPADFAEARKGVKFYDKPTNLAYFGTLAKPGQAGELVALGNKIWTQLGKLSQPIAYDAIIEPRFLGAE